MERSSQDLHEELEDVEKKELGYEEVGDNKDDSYNDAEAHAIGRAQDLLKRQREGKSVPATPTSPDFEQVRIPKTPTPSPERAASKAPPPKAPPQGAKPPPASASAQPPPPSPVLCFSQKDMDDMKVNC